MVASVAPMLIFLLNYLPIILLAAGLILVVVRPVVLKTGKPITALARKQLWFWQAVGFWALVIGAFMIGEKVVPPMFAGDETTATTKG
jgi:hypothetical protein